MNNAILGIQAHAEALRYTIRERAKQSLARHDERGSVTLDHLLWAVAGIVVVGIAVAALTYAVNIYTAQLRGV